MKMDCVSSGGKKKKENANVYLSFSLQGNKGGSVPGS